MYQRFSGKGRLVDMHWYGFEELAIGGYFFTGFQNHDIAYYNILFEHLCNVFVANDFIVNLVVYLIENFELFIGFMFKIESDTCSQEYSKENPYGL